MNSKGITTKSVVNSTQILFNTQLQQSVGVQVSATGVTAASDGKKIVKAGTPLTGSLEARETAFTKATTTDNKSNAVGVLLHDVDVTNGDNNATCLIFGFVNLNRIDATTQALITAEVKAALTQVTFLKG